MATTCTLVLFSVSFTSAFSAVFSEWEDATMFSYVDMKDKIAIMAKKMKYFTHKGKWLHPIHGEYYMWNHSQIFQKPLLHYCWHIYVEGIILISNAPVNWLLSPSVVAAGAVQSGCRPVTLMVVTDVCRPGLILTTWPPANNSEYFFFAQHIAPTSMSESLKPCYLSHPIGKLPKPSRIFGFLSWRNFAQLSHGVKMAKLFRNTHYKCQCAAETARQFMFKRWHVIHHIICPLLLSQMKTG